MTDTLPVNPSAGAVTIRPYRAADHRACRRIWAELAQVWPVRNRPARSTDPGAGFEEYLTRLDLSGIWVADASPGGVVGFVGLLLHGRSGEVEPVVVTADRRGVGIGTALLKKVGDEAARRGLSHLSISPAADNVAAVRCFRRAGYDVLSSVTLARDIGRRTADHGAGVELHGLHFRG